MSHHDGGAKCPSHDTLSTFLVKLQVHKRKRDSGCKMNKVMSFNMDLMLNKIVKLEKFLFYSVSS